MKNALLLFFVFASASAQAQPVVTLPAIDPKIEFRAVERDHERAERNKKQTARLVLIAKEKFKSAVADFDEDQDRLDQLRRRYRIVNDHELSSLSPEKADLFETTKAEFEKSQMALEARKKELIDAEVELEKAHQRIFLVEARVEAAFKKSVGNIDFESLQARASAAKPVCQREIDALPVAEFLEKENNTDDVEEQKFVADAMKSLSPNCQVFVQDSLVLEMKEAWTHMMAKVLGQAFDLVGGQVDRDAYNAYVNKDNDVKIEPIVKNIRVDGDAVTTTSQTQGK